MFTQQIPTYDLKGNRVKLPAFSPSASRETKADNNDYHNEITKLFGEFIKSLTATGENNKLITEFISAIEGIFARKERMDALRHGQMNEMMALAKDNMVKAMMDMEKEAMIKKDKMEIARHKEMMGLLTIIAGKDDSNVERLISELTNAVKNMPAPQIVLPEPIKEVKKEEQPNLMRPASGKRIKIKWVIATSPNLAGTESITGVIDGVNKDFYVSGSPIKNSEQIRLNQGAPMSYGEDYTNTANKYTFVTAPPTGSKLEIKWQK